MSDNDHKLIITLKKNELDMLKKFKEKYSSPASILKDYINNLTMFATNVINKLRNQMFTLLVIHDVFKLLKNKIRNTSKERNMNFNTCFNLAEQG